MPHPARTHKISFEIAQEFHSLADFEDEIVAFGPYESRRAGAAFLPSPGGCGIEEFEEMSFSRETTAFLEGAGWFVGRKFDTTRYERDLRKGGFPVHACVIELLSEFGGLQVTFKARSPGQRFDYFHLNVSKEVKKTYFVPDGPDFQATGTHLCPIGGIWRGYGGLDMDENGTIYAIAETQYFRVPGTSHEAIENLCQGIFVPLPRPSPEQ